MKLILFKSKTCGICKLLEPQVRKAAETLEIEPTFVDVGEDEKFQLWKELTTKDLLEKFDIRSAGKLVFLADDTKEDGPMILFERPQKAEDLLKSINGLIGK